MVSDESLPHVEPLYRYRTVRQFTDDVDFFLKHYQPVGLSDLLAHISGGKDLPPRAFLLTFDDGFREMAEIVSPILKSKGVPAVFFINSAFVDNRELCRYQKMALLVDLITRKPSPALEKQWGNLLKAKGLVEDEVIPMLRSVKYAQRSVLDEAAAVCGLDFAVFLSQQKPYLISDQIRGLLHDGFAIGGHSVDHPFYGDLPLTEQLRQTRESVEFLCERFGVSQRAFAFPHSDAAVSSKFFERIFGDGTLQISFGTGGLVRNGPQKHFQRFSMEKTALRAQSIMAYQYARRAIQDVTGRNTPGH